MGTPLITVGITCYNEGDWLLECWESVLAQTDDRWTAVIVMDGTTDRRTREVFGELSHPKLRKCALTENKGPYPARNRAFELTHTPYHFYLDGDDQLMPDTIATVLETFRRSTEADFVYGDVERFGTRSSLTRKAPSFTLDDLISGIYPAGPSAYKKALWERLGGFSDELAYGMADYDFFFGAYEAGAKGVHCGRTIYRWRAKDTASISGSYLHRYHEKCEIIIRRHPRLFRDPDRVRRLMARGYDASARANYAKGRYREALHCAFHAMLYGDAKVSERLRNHWWYFAPPWSFRVADSLFRKVRNVLSSR